MKRYLIFLAVALVLCLVALMVEAEEYDEGTEMLLIEVPVADGGLGTASAAASGDTRVTPGGDTRVTPGGDTRVIP